MAELNVSEQQCVFQLFLLSFPFSFFFLFLSFLRAVQNYFSDPWNVFDFIIVLGSFVDILYSEITVSYSLKM